MTSEHLELGLTDMELIKAVKDKYPAHVLPSLEWQAIADAATAKAAWELRLAIIRWTDNHLANVIREHGSIPPAVGNLALGLAKFMENAGITQPDSTGDNHD